VSKHGKDREKMADVTMVNAVLKMVTSACDFMKVTFDKMLRASLAYAKSVRAAHGCQNEEPTMSLGDPPIAEVVKDVKVSDISRFSFLIQSTDKIYDEAVRKSPTLKAASVEHVMDLLKDMEAACEQVEDCGGGFEVCHPNTCWKKGLDNSADEDLQKILMAAATTVSTCDPNTMARHLAALGKADFVRYMSVC
ncbi:hypothetical protein AK812_SmicGene48643, partial [Symbiodinium microadriaticum]